MAPRSIRHWWMPEGWRVLVFQSAAEIDEHLAAELVVTANRGDLRRVGLASGRTFAGFFQRLGKAVDDGRARFDGVDFHHLDEFEGVAPGSPGSLSAEIRAALFADERPERGRFHAVDARTGQGSVDRHEAALSSCDVVLLGAGANGHVAFNEPGGAIDSTSRFAALADDTRAAHAPAFAGRPVPARALTAGLRTILSARRILFVATGAGKSGPVRDALCGPITPACPASAIRLHDRVDVLLDEPAAAALADAAAPPFQATATEVRDRTSLGLRGPTVVVAPHPDDASISCGGVMSMLDPDAMRHIVTFSTGARAIDGVPAEEARAIREREAEEEADVQGASVSFLRARAYASGSFEPEDARDLVAVLDRCRPARVLLPAREDPHPTHRLCRLTAEDALATHWRGAPRRIELWTFEGPWCLLERGAINLVVRLDPHARERKRAGIRAHRSQVDRVPFDDGAAALERLRAIAFSESHLGGRGCAFDPDSRIECYRRVVLG